MAKISSWAHYISKSFLHGMSSTEVISAEQLILRACLRGELSPDIAFNELYMLYAPVVKGWLIVSVKAAEADDLFQDIWVVFYRRWQQWQFLPEMGLPEAKPVASFLYKTFRFVLEGHRRRVSSNPESIEEMDVPDNYDSSNRLLQQLDVGVCMDVARRVCSPEEMDVLLAKLAGISARDIAKTLSISESVVDHRFRKAISRLRKRLKGTKNPKARK